MNPAIGDLNRASLSGGPVTRHHSIPVIGKRGTRQPASAPLPAGGI
jgi:hypothetical protein